MKFGRIFANAISRRVAYVLVAMALAWLGFGEARAQTYSTQCTQPSANCTQGDAYSVCASNVGLHAITFGNNGNKCVLSPNETTRHYFTAGPSGSPVYLNGVSPNYYFSAAGSCAAQPSQTFASDARIPTGSVGCANGGPGNDCEFVVTSNGDGTYTRSFSIPGLGACEVIPDCPTGPLSQWYMHPGTGLCQPVEQECAANQTKNPKTGACDDACPSGMVADPEGLCKPASEDCPAGNVRAPSGQCLPGEGQCAAGEARRPNGTCGRDSDGDGQADEDDEDPENDPDRETASGGDSCSAPPSCSGGPIDCLQAKIQWRIDCNTRHKVNVTGGACGAMPVCVGENCKAMEYAQLLQQWKAACALEKLANADGGGEGGNNADLIALLTGPGSINGEHGGTGGMPGGDGPFQWGEGEEHEPDTAGFGYGSSCPSPPSFTVGGRTISIDLTIMCQWVSLAGSIVLVLAGLASVRIVSGGIA